MTLVLSLILGPILGITFANVQHTAQIVSFPPAITERPLDHIWFKITPWILATTAFIIGFAYLTNLHTAIFLACLLIIAKIDYKFGLIPDILLLIAFLATIPHMSSHGFLMAIGLWIGLYFIDQTWAKFRGYNICGRGDIKLMALAGFWISLHDLSQFLILVGVLSLVMLLIRQTRAFPLAPAIVTALIIIHVINWLWPLS